MPDHSDSLPASEVQTQIVCELERLIRRDPGGRGLIGPEDDARLGRGELLPAAQDLATRGRSVCLVTGFFIPCSAASADRSSSAATGFAETDGPLGTTLLAAVLRDLGQHVLIVTDENCAQVVNCAVDALNLPLESVHVAPLASATWRMDFWRNAGQDLTHFIAIERVGPGHTRASLSAQQKSSDLLDAFTAAVGADEEGHCYNMRSVDIDQFTGDLHGLFEEFPLQRTNSCSIGIGDGGNEIGMGRFPWEVLRNRLPDAVGAKIPCRIATDYAIVAGTSNWGAYALAAATASLLGRVDVLARHTADDQLRVLERLVRDAQAVDGITRRHEPTVDGLPFLTYIQPWVGMRRILGLD